MTENDSKNITVEEFLKTTVKVSQSVFYRFVFVTSGGVFVGDWFLEKNVSLGSTVTIHNVVFTNNAGEKVNLNFCWLFVKDIIAVAPISPAPLEELPPVQMQQ